MQTPYSSEGSFSQTTNIGIVAVGRNTGAFLLNAIAKMNKTQSAFHFEFLGHKPITDPLPAGKHSYPNKFFYTLLDDVRVTSGYHYVIGITHSELDDSRFNVHDVSSG